jgi:hypothetical protein
VSDEDEIFQRFKKFYWHSDDIIFVQKFDLEKNLGSKVQRPLFPKIWFFLKNSVTKFSRFY